jgi:hypothetical protein
LLNLGDSSKCEHLIASTVASIVASVVTAVELAVRRTVFCSKYLIDSKLPWSPTVQKLDHSKPVGFAKPIVVRPINANDSTIQPSVDSSNIWNKLINLLVDLTKSLNIGVNFIRGWKSLTIEYGAGDSARNGPYKLNCRIRLF